MDTDLNTKHDCISCNRRGPGVQKMLHLILSSFPFVSSRGEGEVEMVMGRGGGGERGLGVGRKKKTSCKFAINLNNV